MTASFMVYGAYGYTGELVAEEAARRGLPAILAGRDRGRTETLAERLGLPWRAFALDDPGRVVEGLHGVDTVLHCAGPFSRTAAPMVDGCLAAGVHYLDVTGEIEVFAAVHGRDREARQAGIMAMPGVGFDVVPSDCLAAHLAKRLPSADRLVLAFQGIGAPSRGTATTMAENLGRGGAIRRGGRLVPVPAAWRNRSIDFGRGPVAAMSIPWGDVYTAHITTGIPDIEVYMAAPRSMYRVAVASRYLARLMQSGPFQALARWAIRRQPPGPTAEQRARGASLLWGEVRDADGRRATSRLRGPEGYTTTMLAALAIVDKVLAGEAPSGFQTPAGAYGADLILELEGFEREDLANGPSRRD